MKIPPGIPGHRPPGQWARKAVPRGTWSIYDVAELWGVGPAAVRVWLDRTQVERGTHYAPGRGPGGIWLKRPVTVLSQATVEMLTRIRSGYPLPGDPVRPKRKGPRPWRSLFRAISSSS